MNSIYDKECILIEINSRLLGFDMDDISMWMIYTLTCIIV